MIEASEDVAVSAEAASMSLDSTVEREEIARLAYHLWEARGGHGGTPEEDWLRAEQEYRNKHAAVGR